MKKRVFAVIVLLVLSSAVIAVFNACANGKEPEQPPLSSQKNAETNIETTESRTAAQSDSNQQIEIDTYVILNDEKTTINGEGAAFKNNILTISKPGTYSLKGKLSDGHILVNCADESKKVKLYFDGIDIYCSSTAPVFVENSPKETQIILAENSKNSLSDNADRAVSEDMDYATATIYSKDDLQIEGNGTLTIDAKFGKGIFSKNDVQIRDGIINITSADDGVRGKDSVEISGGALTVVCGGDAIRTKSDEADKGDITISGGALNLKSTLDSVQASGNLSITGGSITAEAGGGAGEETIGKAEGGFDFHGGRPDMPDSSFSETAQSQKGIKADGDITISGGNLEINSLDDAFHSGADLEISGGNSKVKTGDDAFHCEEELEISGGSITVLQSYEGLEGQKIDVSGGVISIKSQDDGINSADADSKSEEFGNVAPKNLSANGGSEKNRNPVEDRRTPGEYNSECGIQISGGSLTINAEGDGIDSNGDIKMTGGNVIIFGSESGGNGALDYAGSFEHEGGTLLAIGSSGMAQGLTKGEYLQFDCSVESNKTVTIADQNLSEIITFVSPKRFSNVVFASNGISKNSEYTVFEGTNHSGSASNGIYESGSFSGGSAIGTYKAVGE